MEKNLIREMRDQMRNTSIKLGEKPFEHLGIIIVPNIPLRWEQMKGDEWLENIWKEAVEVIEKQLGISVLEDDALVQVRVFDADHRDKDTNLQDHWSEWGVQTNWKDNYDYMSRYLPLSLLKNYKQGDVIKIKANCGVDLEMKCLVKYLSVGETLEETLEKIA